MMELISIRLARETVEQLRALARCEAARRNQDVTWAAIVREAIDERLAAEAKRLGAVKSLADTA